MTGTGRVVFGDDGGEASDRAWRWLAAHGWPGWTIDGLTADTDPAHIRWGQPPQPTEWTPGWARDPADIPSATVRHLRAVADPRFLLAATDADLLVVGIRERSGVRARLMGSTAEWLLHHPPAPLAVVRRTDPVRSVLVCADGSTHADRAIRSFVTLPLAGDCTVTVLTVADGRAQAGTAESVASDISAYVHAVSTLELSGDPTDAILDTAHDTDCDLIVMGTRGLTGWQRLRLGSTASTVVHAVHRDHLLASVD
ncbi:MAG: universal stress protein [Acidimicrobiia bacterium]|nr:universal stress protein [Acidimicrobiia bacterium]